MPRLSQAMESQLHQKAFFDQQIVDKIHVWPNETKRISAFVGTMPAS